MQKSEEVLTVAFDPILTTSECEIVYEDLCKLDQDDLAETVRKELEGARPATSCRKEMIQLAHELGELIDGMRPSMILEMARGLASYLKSLE
jgi:hypothetical protein